MRPVTEELTHVVMAVLVTAIHVFGATAKSWMAGPRRP